MSKIFKVINALFSEHQTAASLLTIIVSFIAINSWMTTDIRYDIRELRADTRETNKRIDALFHYVLTKQELGKHE